MKYQVILFDADGVVIKSQQPFSKQLEADYAITADKLQPFFVGVFPECSLGRADLKQELAKVMSDWGWKGTVDELLNFWFTKGTQVDTEVVEFIRSLRRSGIRTFMTTDQEKYRGEHLRHTLGEGKLFEQVFFSAEVGHSKKESAFFEYVYNAINKVSRDISSTHIDRDQVLFVDDTDKNIEVAKQFGFDAHLYKDLPAFKQYLSIL